MANGFIVVEKEDWERATKEDRDLMVYNTLKSINDRIAKLEKQVMFRTALNFFGCVSGGALGMFAIHLCRIKPF